jgi:hypothetical protein
MFINKDYCKCHCAQVVESHYNFVCAESIPSILVQSKILHLHPHLFFYIYIIFRKKRKWKCLLTRVIANVTVLRL